MSKDILFHLPYHMSPTYPSGSTIRPKKMLQAFERLGYEADVVTGYGAERREQIGAIQEGMARGKDYRFLYSESSVFPTLLTERNRLPLYPDLDFRLFRCAKRRGIPLGLYYRDIWWRFPFYEGGTFNRLLVSPFHYYDLLVYRGLLDVLFLQSDRMRSHLPRFMQRVTTRELPPGCDETPTIPAPDLDGIRRGPLRLIYVGGIGKAYDLRLLVDVVSKDAGVGLTLCTRQQDWQTALPGYRQHLGENVRVLHPMPEDLPRAFSRAHVASLFLQPNDYRSFVMPLKLYEYIQFEKPILATRGTSAADFIEAHDIGWAVPYDRGALEAFLADLKGAPETLAGKIDNLRRLKPAHTWLRRAAYAAEVLSRPRPRGPGRVETRPGIDYHE